MPTTARWKVTLGLALGGTGGSESYISPLTTDTAMTTKLSELLRYRLACMHNSVRVTTLRIAQVANDQDLPVKRRSQMYRPGTIYPFIKPDANGLNGVAYVLPGGGSQTAADYAPDLDRSCLMVRLLYSGGRTTQRYLFGWPDASLKGIPPTVDLGLVPALTQNFGNFVNQLVGQGWCIRCRGIVAPFQIVPIKRWVQSEANPSLVGVVVDKASSPAYVVGGNDGVQISNTRRRGTDKMSYNGRYIVASTADTATEVTIYLAATEAGDATSVKLPGTIQRRGYIFDPITGLETVMGGTHKRGKPLDSPRGNRRKRALLDP